MDTFQCEARFRFEEEPNFSSQQHEMRKVYHIAILDYRFWVDLNRKILGAEALIAFLGCRPS